MVVVAHFVKFLVFYVTAQCSSQIRPFQVMGCQSISRQKSLTVSVCDQFRHDTARLHVKTAGRTQNPDHIAAVSFFVLQQPDQRFIIIREGSFPAPALPECKGVLCISFLFLRPAVVVNINAFTGIFRAAHHHQISFPYISELYHVDFFALFIPHRHSIHPAVFRQIPLSVDLKIFRKDRGGVKALRRGLGMGRQHQLTVGCIDEAFLRKIRFDVFR